MSHTIWIKKFKWTPIKEFSELIIFFSQKGYILHTLTSIHSKSADVRMRNCLNYECNSMIWKIFYLNDITWTNWKLNAKMDFFIHCINQILENFRTKFFFKQTTKMRRTIIFVHRFFTHCTFHRYFERCFSTNTFFCKILLICFMCIAFVVQANVKSLTDWIVRVCTQWCNRKPSVLRGEMLKYTIHAYHSKHFCIKLFDCHAYVYACCCLCVKFHRFFILWYKENQHYQSNS